jgi:predicted GNAT family acetyltransferase
VNVEIRPISTSNWNDFVLLMNSDSQCSDCWCLNHRAAPGCPTGDLAKETMKTLLQDGKVHGLLAFTDKLCVGWIAIDPITEMIGHDCQNTAKSNEWSIHCIFIKDGFRGKGLSIKMIKAAVEYAKFHNAQVISAFPIPDENRIKFPPNASEFSGRFSTYSKLGFQIDGNASEFYQRVELIL